MHLIPSRADLFVPDGSPVETALQRTTHLAVGAHQDDIEFMAYHGISECFQRTDLWFTGIVITDGANSPRAGIYAQVSDQKMKAIRRQEQKNAAMVGNYSCQIQLSYSSSQVKNPKCSEVIQDLKQIFSLAKARVIYLHNPADKHDTHVASCLKCIAALRELPIDAQPDTVYGCEIWRSLDWLTGQDSHALPNDARPNLAAALNGLFDSQISGGKRYDLAVAGRRVANATFNESHAVDDIALLTLAMDLSPLIKNPLLSIWHYTHELISHFSEDVQRRIFRLSNQTKE